MYDGDLIKKILLQLNPEISMYINLDCLVPYLNRFTILTRIERSFLSNPLKSPNEKIAYLLDALEGKDANSVNNFLTALRQEKEHTGHMLLHKMITDDLKAKQNLQD